MNRRITLAFCFFLFQAQFGLCQGFKKVPVDRSGIEFKNQLSEDDTINALSYLYLYNGGGVAVGDINNDGLDDIYFTGNQVEDKLYLNKGNLQFKDVTKKYFKNQKFDFHTGATMVDINNDGWLDIYVLAGGPDYDGEKRRNKLFINQKGKKFLDEAAAYGLDDSLNATQATFLDADQDGDLDVYLLNHPYHRKNAQRNFQLNSPKKVIGNDRLMMNNNGQFEDQSDERGILSTGYGLGVAISDFNGDLFPDIYVTNDFEYPDKFFINKGDGFFEEVILDRMQHISLFAMGVDAGDINNDGLIDLISTDMASEDHVRSKKNMGGMSSENFWTIVNTKKHYQYMFNSLQLNLGDASFIEIAQMAGISKTDWSWATLLADYDNDGFQDLFIANGYVRDIRDNDFKIKYDGEIEPSKDFIPFEELKDLIPTSKLQNYIFKNTGELTFEKKSFEWGFSEKVNVNGAAYADLDNDGDLDLVCNALNDVSFIMENKMGDRGNYIQIELSGESNNLSAVGARLELYAENKTFVKECYPSRGFQSSVSSIMHFGLGAIQQIDSLVIYWKKGERTVHTDLTLNDRTAIEWATSPSEETPQNDTFSNLVNTKVDGLNYVHHEIDYDDFEKEILLPHKMSNLGPFISVADVNGDQLEDIYIGSARGDIGHLYFQKQDGGFRIDTNSVWESTIHLEEMESVFFDVDNDGDLDLYVVSGGNEAPVAHPSLKDRVYINDGKGHFTLDEEKLPEFRDSGQKVIAKDLNGDGWMDVLIFGRQVPEAYPSPATSRILMNEQGVLIDQTANMAPDFWQLGMVTDAEFTDYDKDGDEDLIIVGEWMPVTVFENNQGKFRNVTAEKELLNTVGWWNSIDVYDDSEDFSRFVLGNVGENNKFHPSEKKPLRIYMNDFDDNGTFDIVLAKNQESTLYPVRGRQCSSEQMPFITEKFPTYDQFAVADVTEIYTDKKLDEAIQYQAQTFSNSSLIIIDGEFDVKPLPQEYQTGPINACVVEDFTGDGISDVLCIGNKFEAEVETVRYDGNPGYLINGALGLDDPVYLDLKSNIKSASLLKIGKRTLVVLGVNQGEMILLEIAK